MFYVPYGPFDVPKTGHRKGNWQLDFWTTVEGAEKGLAKANGVYIFGLSFGGKIVPFYVGKTCSTNGFYQEVFQRHKLDKYREIEKSKRGKPLMYLIAKAEENRGNFCRYSKRSSSQIEQLETYLIGMGLTINPKLKNDKKTSFHRNLDVEGVIGPRYKGARRTSARSLRKTLGLPA